MASGVSNWYNWYHTAEKLVDYVDYVFEGTVTDVKFEIFDSYSDETVVSAMADPFLFTMYKIEIEKVYKGNLNEDSSVWLIVYGGRPGYMESDQIAVIEKNGIEYRGSIPHCEDSVTFDVGDRKLFALCDWRWEGTATHINPRQTAFDIGIGNPNDAEPNYNNIVKYFSEIKEQQ